MARFEDRNVVVTGGTGALGFAMVSLLEQAGARVIVPRGVDLTSEAAAAGFFDGVPEPLWASIHLVGGFAMGKLAGTSLADLRAQHDVNVVTCFLSCREA